MRAFTKNALIFHITANCIVLVDAKTIRLCCKGDRQGHKAMYESTVRYVYATVCRYIQGEEDRRDVVQESYAKVFAHIGTYSTSKGTFNTWLRKVTVNECFMHLRKHKKHSVMVPVDIHAHQLSSSDGAELEGLTRKDIEEMLLDMPYGYKVVFFLSVMDGYDHKEIAEMLDIQPETSRSQLTRAKNWIRKQLCNRTNTNAYGLF